MHIGSYSTATPHRQRVHFYFYGLVAFGHTNENGYTYPCRYLLKLWYVVRRADEGFHLAHSYDKWRVGIPVWRKSKRVTTQSTLLGCTLFVLEKRSWFKRQCKLPGEVDCALDRVLSGSHLEERRDSAQARVRSCQENVKRGTRIAFQLTQKDGKIPNPMQKFASISCLALQISPFFLC